MDQKIIDEMKSEVEKLGRELAVLAQAAEVIRFKRFIYAMALYQAGIEMGQMN